VNIIHQPLPDADPAAEDEIFEMANLPRSMTGVPGTIYISTMQGPHGPRVKWYPDRPGRDAPCLTVTFEEPPRIINHGVALPAARIGEAQVPAWLLLNRAALLDFWFHGESWTIDKVHAFAGGLAKVP
jgi:hypothetical protein